MTLPLAVEGANKRFGTVQALDQVDLTVPSGALVAVLGPSGCGKTTLLRCVAGFEHLDAGLVTIAGRTVAGPGVHVPTHRRGVGIVPQEGAVFPHLSVGANVGFGLPGGFRRNRGRVAEFLDLVGLAGLAARMPHELSGGQQQRVALARALAPGPALVLLDEPFSALDAGLRVDLRRDVREVLRRQGTTAVLVTHDQAEALSIADHVAVMRDGRVVQAGTPVELYANPAQEWVASFLGEATWLSGYLDSGVLRTRFGVIRVETPTPDGPARALVRPEQLTLVEGSDAVVGQVDFHGHDALIRLSLESAPPALARLANPVTLPRIGDRVGVRVTGRALLVDVKGWSAAPTAPEMPSGQDLVVADLAGEPVALRP